MARKAQVELNPLAAVEGSFAAPLRVFAALLQLRTDGSPEITPLNNDFGGWSRSLIDVAKALADGRFTAFRLRDSENVRGPADVSLQMGLVIREGSVQSEPDPKSRRAFVSLVAAEIRSMLAGGVSEAALSNGPWNIELRLSKNAASLLTWMTACLPQDQRDARQVVAKRISDEFEHVRGAVGTVIANAPTEYGERIRALDVLRTVVTVELAKAIEPSINARAATMPHETYEEKKELATWVNAELRRFGLALKGRDTAEPCLLMANPGGRPGFGRFVVYYTDEAGKRHDVLTSVSLPPLNLVPEQLSRAPYGRRTGRTQ